MSRAAAGYGCRNDVYFRESTDGVTAVRARPHEPVRPATHDTVHQGGMDRPPPTGGRSETYTSNLPPRRTLVADPIRIPFGASRRSGPPEARPTGSPMPCRTCRRRAEGQPGPDHPEPERQQHPQRRCQGDRGGTEGQPGPDQARPIFISGHLSLDRHETPDCCCEGESSSNVQNRFIHTCVSCMPCWRRPRAGRLPRTHPLIIGCTFTHTLNSSQLPPHTRYLALSMAPSHLSGCLPSAVAV